MTEPVQETAKTPKVNTKPGECGVIKRLFRSECNAPKPVAAAPAQEGDLDAGAAAIKDRRTSKEMTADQKAAQLLGI